MNPSATQLIHNVAGIIPDKMGLDKSGQQASRLIGRLAIFAAPIDMRVCESLSLSGCLPACMPVYLSSCYLSTFASGCRSPVCIRLNKTNQCLSYPAAGGSVHLAFEIDGAPTRPAECCSKSLLPRLLRFSFPTDDPENFKKIEYDGDAGQRAR